MSAPLLPPHLGCVQQPLAGGVLLDAHQQAAHARLHARELLLAIRETVGPDMGIKAAGGIRSAEDMEDMIAAGATRIGASAGVAIVTGGESSEQY